MIACRGRMMRQELKGLDTQVGGAVRLAPADVK